jgi:histidine ammonia-lyase
MAMLAMMASQALHVTDRLAPPALQLFLEDIRAIMPPVDDDRVLGPELAELAAWFTRQSFEA